MPCTLRRAADRCRPPRSCHTTSHADEVIETLADTDGVALVELIKRGGETRVRDQGVLDRPVWKWSP
ncbi:hypothetical protein ACTD5D_15915 [Nocardia takedensis]|uniref:hypothetical protein n=1 Tax=Nocardia takedensis TaxID=259390 RepID=UPI0003072AF9|nr:hypothetical protein [Nocardia takedensis]